MTLPFLTTKLYIPPRRPEEIARPRLLQRLQSGLQSGARLTLISAPPGYGKTSLAAEWIEAEHSQHAAAWISLDEGDNDPARFFATLIAALQTLRPEAGLAAQSLLGVPRLPAAEEIITLLSNDLTSNPTRQPPVLLVLDDYHRIHSEYIHAGLQFWLEAPVAPLHLVLLTREDPPLQLARLRARRQLIELRLSDLRFTPAEARQFLDANLGTDLAPSALAMLEKRTEGWITGLQMAALALQGMQERAAEFIDDFGASHRFVMDYLVEEVLRQQPEPVRQFLIQTSILERFNAELCAHMLENETTGSSTAMLQHLERSNLFLVPLDGERRWFRYHHLFAEFLRLELPRERQSTLHQQAAAWFEAHDDLPQAVTHALAAGDNNWAGQLVSRAADELVRHGELYTLLSWLKALPPHVVQSDLKLATNQTLALLLTGEVARAIEVLGAVQSGAGLKQASAQPGDLGRLQALQAWLQMIAGQADVLPVSQAALKNLQDDPSFFTIAAGIAHGTALQWAGRLEESNAAFRQAYALGQRTGQHFAALGALANLIFNLIEQGKLGEARGLCQSATSQYVDRRGQPLPILGMIYIPLSVVLFSTYQLEEAQSYAEQGLELCQTVLSSAMMGGDAEQVLAEIALARGQRQTALGIAQATRQYAQEHGVAFLQIKMLMLESNLHLCLGELPASQNLLAEIERASAAIPNASRATRLAQKRLLLESGQFQETLEDLDEMEQIARQSGYIVRLIQIRLLQALAYHGLGQAGAGSVALEEAVLLAAPEAQRWPFFHFGPQSARRLLRLLPGVQPAAPGFVASLIETGKARLQALAPGEAPLDHAVPTPRPTGAASVEVEALIEPLSEQERNVLRLVAAGRSNQEIADELFISLGTAKWHVHNILGKLGVNSRAQAIARARELGLA